MCRLTCSLVSSLAIQVQLLVRRFAPAIPVVSKLATSRFGVPCERDGGDQFILLIPSQHSSKGRRKKSEVTSEHHEKKSSAGKAVSLLVAATPSGTHPRFNFHRFVLVGAKTTRRAKTWSGAGSGAVR